MEKETTNRNKHFYLAIILSLFIPGLGNLLMGQTKLAIKLIIATVAISVFYFIPMFFFFLLSESQMTFLFVTSVIAVIALFIDIGLLVYSIYRIIKD